MFKTILAAVDGPRHGDLVAQSAGELAALGASRLLIAYIADPGVANDELEEVVETSLRRAGLWDDIRMSLPGTSLSGGEQQRLCIARAIAVQPDLILMDEPCPALDPLSTARVEGLIDDLRERYTIIIVTPNLQQAARVSQRTAFFNLGRLLDVGDTEEMFIEPKLQRTSNFITGRFG